MTSMEQATVQGSSDVNGQFIRFSEVAKVTYIYIRTFISIHYIYNLAQLASSYVYMLIYL